MTTEKRKKRALVIDDHEPILEFIKDTLETEDFEVTTSTNGLQGIDTYHVCDCDIVITDLNMPEKDGLEVIKELRYLYPPVPIIAISGADRSGILMQVAKLYEADFTLNKPFTAGELLETVHNALSRTQNA
jgi:DNA-binding response OmpR family regulator